MPLRYALRDRQRREREELKARQGRLYARLMAAIDITGTTRRRQEEARKTLSAAHAEQRQALSERHREMQRSKVAAVKDRFEVAIEAAHSRRIRHLSALHDKHGSAERFADYDRQQREIDREESRLVTERKIQEWSRRRTTSFAAGQDGESGGHGKGDGKGDSELARAFRRAKELEEEQRRRQAERNAKDRNDYGR